MKWCLIGGMLVLGGTALIADAVPGPVTEGPSEALWWTDYEAARVAARRSGRPLLVVFR